MRKELWAFPAAMFAVLLVGLALRLHGIHDPIMDHPGWRQGDTASIARNFARLQYNVMYPQTMYDGPPPNYVELELQIVPFFAATLYKAFGVHAIFGRLLSIAFSLGTVATIAFFARWLFGSALAGIIAAFFYAVFPGSVYYGRTFMPDTAMVFFLTAALYAAARYLLEDAAMAPRALARTTALVTFAYLAKPVAVIALVPLAGTAWQRLREGLRTRPSALAVLFAIPLLILWLYDHRVASYAEWHWTSGITKLHVLPALRAAFTGTIAFVDKLTELRAVFEIFRNTMLGTAGTLAALIGFAGLPWVASRSRALLWCWLAAALAYAYVVVTVEHVDYYLYLLLPPCALAIGGTLARWIGALLRSDAAATARYAIVALVPLLGLATLVQGRAAVRGYYAYNRQAYLDAIALDRALPPGAIVVIGHYGPDVQYYVNRFGWEEDPVLWTPFDEESAIRKGARYFVSVEDNRLRSNVELCAWLQRFPVLGTDAAWPVYRTDPALERPGAERFWRAFRAAERAGRARAFLDAHHVCQRWMNVKTRRAFSNASGLTVTPPRNG